MLQSRQLRDLFTLQGEARELGALTAECRQHVLSRTAQMLHAAAGCLVLDGNAGRGRPGKILDCVLYNFDGVTRPAFQPLLERGSAFHPVVGAMFDVHGGDGIAVDSGRDLLAARDWYQSPYYCDFVRQVGFDESMISTRGAGRPGFVHGFGFFRERGQRAFTAADKLILRLVEFGLGPQIHRPVFAVGAERGGLSPRERDVLDLLLQGLSDKEVGVQLGISRNTVNQRVKGLFFKLGVHSRAELMARYLRGALTGR